MLFFCAVSKRENATIFVRGFFCEMIQLLPVDIAQKRDDKSVREIGDQ